MPAMALRDKDVFVRPGHHPTSWPRFALRALQTIASDAGRSFDRGRDAGFKKWDFSSVENHQLPPLPSPPSSAYSFVSPTLSIV